MAIESPEVLVPTSGGHFRTTATAQTISGTAPAEATQVTYRYVLTSANPVFSGPRLSSAVSMTSSNPDNLGAPVPWSFNTSLLGEDLYSGVSLFVEFYTENDSNGDVSFPTLVQVEFTSVTQLPISAPVPTGLSVERSNQALKPSCAEVDLEGYSGDFLGYNFYVSLEPGGGAAGYSLMNEDYVTIPSSYKLFQSDQGTTEQKSGDIVVKTNTVFQVEVPQYSFALDGATLSRLTGSGVLPNQNYDNTTTFYFVVTASVYDEALGAVVESTFSPEISARFVTFAAVFNEIPVRNRDQISVTLMQRLYGKNTKANLMPASVYKDILDPISEEFSDYYVVQDFLSQAQSLSGLMQFDDEDGDGVSDPVATSTKKTRLRLALKLANADAVQNLIDSFFDKKASNFNITRMGPQPARGKATLYADSVPQEGLSISDGTLLTTGPGYGNSNTPVKFKVTGSKFISHSNKETYYNEVLGRYEVSVDIACTTSGSLGNVPTSAINRVISGADPRFKVENGSPTSGGSDHESNLSLGNRTKLAIAGIDSGTRGGYLLKALSVPGVRSASVEVAGSSMMMRDIDPSTGRHIGGKVDVYVQSQVLGEKQDLIAFSYGGPVGAGAEEKFFVEDALNFRIRTTNSNVTYSTPIFEVVRVYNVTRGKNYDLAGATVGLGDGDSIQLAQNTTNLKVGMATMDVIEVDYRYRGSNVYILDHQPVRAIVSVSGDIDGVLPKESYELVKLEDPLINGESTISQDGVAINFFDGFPTESTRNVKGEAHNFFSNKPIKIAKKGVDIDTLVVSSDKEGIDVYEKDLDYTVGKGGQSGFTYLYLEPFSKIRASSRVYISYSHSQNLTVVYTVNDSLQRVQDVLSETGHATSDVVVKGSVFNYVDISLQVVRRKGYTREFVENKIRTRLGNYVDNLHVGKSLYMDDVIALVKSTEGVARLVLPVTRMMKRNDSFISRDYLGFADFRIYTQNSSKGVTSYITTKPVLNYGTSENGGSENLFRMVYEGDQSLVMAASPLDVSSSLGRGYIQSDGRIIVSTTNGAPPQSKEYRASYFTYVPPEEEFASDIKVDKVETLLVDGDSIRVDASAEEV